MLFSNKLIFSYIFSGLSFSFVSGSSQKLKNTYIIVPSDLLGYSAVHFKLSSVFYSSQLVDIFSYEVLNPHSTSFWGGNSLRSLKPQSKSLSTLLVYNFHSLLNKDRFFLFVYNSRVNSSGANSIADLFFSANWLEREVLELHGFMFFFKKDIRNLMLQYGDSSAPFQKSFPTVGLSELFYDPIKDTLISSPVTLQI